MICMIHAWKEGRVAPSGRHRAEYSSYRSFSSLCWLPTTTPSSSRCAKRGACRSALPRPPVRISSVFVPQILRDAPLGSRAKRRTAASSARKSAPQIGCCAPLEIRIQNTRPLLQAAKAPSIGHANDSRSQKWSYTSALTRSVSGIAWARPDQGSRSAALGSEFRGRVR